MAMTSLVSSGLRAGVRWSLTPGGQALQPTVATDPTLVLTNGHDVQMEVTIVW